MPKYKYELTQERLRELLHYDLETGDFKWIAGDFKGRLAGWVASGRRIIRIDGIQFYASRLAWLYVTGEWTDGIYTLDCNKLNTKWSNLRKRRLKGEPLTQEYLKEILDYNPETGIFVWKTDHGSGQFVGSVAGTIHKKGYIYILINRQGFKAHKLAWLYMTGYYPNPKKQIDHKNNTKNDNRWENLRLVTNQQNCINKRLGIKNTSGYKGVTWCKSLNKWRAQTSYNRKKIFIGYFDDPKEAAKAYNEKVKELFGDFAWLNPID